MPLQLSTPILCYITDRRSLSSEPSGDAASALLGEIESIAAAGVDWIQIREKDLSGRRIARLVREAVARVGRLLPPGAPPTRLLVNDRLDIALAEGAGGMHLAENSLPVEEARRLVNAVSSASSRGSDFLVGVSTHSLGAAKTASARGADYVIFGPIFPTPSKMEYGAPQGLARLAEVCAAVKIPVLAVGGITLENAGACMEVGAAGIAAIRLFQDAADPAKMVRELRKRLSQARSPLG